MRVVRRAMRCFVEKFIEIIIPEEYQITILSSLYSLSILLLFNICFEILLLFFIFSIFVSNSSSSIKKSQHFFGYFFYYRIFDNTTNINEK